MKLDVSKFKGGIDLGRIEKTVKSLLDRTPKDDSLKFAKLAKSKPKEIKWVTMPRQRWAIAYNSKTMLRTNSDVFSSELAVYNYPIGLNTMPTPKKFLASIEFAQLFSSMEWPGADLRPEKKYRKLRSPGVIEVIYP